MLALLSLERRHAADSVVSPCAATAPSRVAAASGHLRSRRHHLPLPHPAAVPFFGLPPAAAQLLVGAAAEPEPPSSALFLLCVAPHTPGGTCCKP